jgi:hypothetical protein
VANNCLELVHKETTMKVFEKNPSRMCSTANFIAAIALIIIFSSALPVKSDAFAIINDNAVQKKVGSTVSQRLYTRSITKVRDSDWSYTQLNAQVDNKSNHAAVIVSNLRGGGGDGPNSMSLAKKISAYASKNFFLLGMIAAVSFAKLFPELGKNGSILRPELFIGKYGVTTIFLLSGISLKLKELTNAMSNVKLNALIQIISFGAWPFLVGLPMTKCLENFLPGLLPTPLVEGLLILTCLPTTINMCIILTSAAGGNGECRRDSVTSKFYFDSSSKLNLAFLLSRQRSMQCCHQQHCWYLPYASTTVAILW